MPGAGDRTVRINTDYLRRCIESLDHSFATLEDDTQPDWLLDAMRAACVKHSEAILEQSGRLLRKRLRPWFATNRQADKLTIRDVFRHAAKHGLISADTSERWLHYRDIRNDTANDEGENFAEVTLPLLPTFIADAIETPDDE